MLRPRALDHVGLTVTDMNWSREKLSKNDLKKYPAGLQGYFELHGKLVRCHRVGCPNRSTPATHLT